MIHDASFSREEGLFQTDKQPSGLSEGNVLYLDQLTGKRKGQSLSVGGGAHPAVYRLVDRWTNISCTNGVLSLRNVSLPNLFLDMFFVVKCIINML